MWSGSRFYDVMKLDIATSAVAINGAKLNLNVWKMDIFVFRLHEATDLKIATIRTAVRLASTKLVVTAALVGVLKFGTPFKPNAIPAPTPITPFD